MSAKATYVIVCDGCGAQYVNPQAPQKLVGDARSQAATYGWTTAAVDTGKKGPRPLNDFCVHCSSRVAIAENRTD
jgi:hypothetical protein